MDSSRIVLPTCEISMDPETAIEGAVSWGVRNFELKTLWEERRVPDITPKQREHLQHLATRYDVRWVALSPGLFIRDEATAAGAEHALSDRLPRSLELAHDLGAEIMLIFSFRQTAGVPEAWVVEHLRKVAEAAEGSGLTLVIEPLAGTYCDSGAALSRIVRAVGHPGLRVNWDPGNVARAGSRAFPDEYAHVRDLVRYVHLKNYDSTTGQWTVFDQGDIDLPAQLQALRVDGYDGYLCIETHTRYNRDGGGLAPIAASKANSA
ncbi:MAG TPA: sugar phosphate isomerase/epimerase family protein, partial [Chloroflexota bacterium]